MVWIKSRACILCAALGLGVADASESPTPETSRAINAIHVSQLGYEPTATKIAILSAVGEIFGEPPQVEIRRADDGLVVLSGLATVWNNGATDALSGDRGWWFDFSGMREPGRYQIVAHGRQSPPFTIAPDILSKLLPAATRTFYYQRLAVPLEPPYAEEPWLDHAAFLQDAQARHLDHPDDPSREIDLSGGWMDAGDSNKYPTFQHNVTHPLLYAYKARPDLFTDDTGIPESHNGLPDILDELAFNLRWLLKMQDSDGGVFNKLGNIAYNSAWPISTDRRPRYYGPKSSAATLWACASFAHAARVYREFPSWEPFAKRLHQAALQAWQHYHSNPRNFACDDGRIKSGSASRTEAEQDRMEAIAAIHLWLLTGDHNYHTRILERAPLTRQLHEGLWSVYEAGPAEALLEYALHPQADPGLRTHVLDHLSTSALHPGWAPPPEASLYRSWMPASAYHWGSCMPQAAYGFSAALAAKHTNLADHDRTRLYLRAADLLHAFHGVNPLGIVYLSNMAPLGATNSIQNLWHDRWGAAAPFPPPPAYVVGGPNRAYLKGQPTGQEHFDRLLREPPARAFADTNDSTGKAWELTENALYYQAYYIRLLVEVAGNGPGAARVHSGRMLPSK